MSKLHFSEDLFIDNLELRRFNKFIFEEGWEDAIKRNVGSFGVVKNSILDPNFNQFRVTQGSPIDGQPTISVAKGHAVAYDSVLDKIKVIRNNFTEPIKFPQDGKWYWVKISHKESTLERGKVSIDEQGNLLGNGTEFTEILRGLPNFPSQIKFYKLDKTDNLTVSPSSLNALEYTVLQVIDDQNAVLQGEFKNETDLYYEVLGTFTPGYIVPDEDKGIFRYDDCEISLVQETTVNGQPLKPFFSQNEEFLIYRVRYEAGTMEIQDYRNEIFKLKGEFSIETVDNRPIPNIGVEKVYFESSNAPRTENLYKIVWGFKSSSYDVFVNDRKITILNGSGGKFKNTNQFTNNDFNGFRLYVLDSVRNSNDADFYSSFEKFFKIKSSLKNGTAIDLTLENFSPPDFIPAEYSTGFNYKNGDKVKTSAGFHRLVTNSATGLNPVQNVWNNGVIYSTNQLVTYQGSTYISLQNQNSGKQPNNNATWWRKVWEQFKPEILIVPDAEEILLYAKVGDDVTGLDNGILNREFSFPIIFGEAQIPLVAVRDFGSSNKDDKIYNVQYRKKNNKVYSNKYVFPSDSIGYVDELGNTVPVDTTYINNGFLKAIKAQDSYTNFKNKVDLGDLFGIYEIGNLESEFSALAGRSFKMKVGTMNRTVVISGDSTVPLTGDCTFDLSTDGARTGNQFKVIFQTSINNAYNATDNSFYTCIFKVDGSTELFRLNSDQIRKGDQILNFEYDSGLGWNLVNSDVSVAGREPFERGWETVDLRQAPTGNLEVINGKNIAVVSGRHNILRFINVPANFSLHGVKFKNNIALNSITFLNTDGNQITFERGNGDWVTFETLSNKRNTLAQSEWFEFRFEGGTNENFGTYVNIGGNRQTVQSWGISMANVSGSLGAGNESDWQDGPCSFTTPNDGIIRSWFITYQESGGTPTGNARGVLGVRLRIVVGGNQIGNNSRIKLDDVGTTGYSEIDSSVSAIAHSVAPGTQIKGQRQYTVSFKGEFYGLDSNQSQLTLIGFPFAP